VAKIRVHEKALAHLSRGLYRSPASALRELVSNAWDANATEVRIDTGAPTFAQVSVSDNGVGFTADDFVRLMDGGIGNSEKRPKIEELINGRQLIGRLGIGMLGIAQICGGFSITSRTADGAAFRAVIRLYDLIKERLDRDDESVVRAAGEPNAATEVDVGEYDIDRAFDASDVGVGTTILTNDVHPTFVYSFHSTYERPPLKWGEVIRRTAAKHTLQELGDYWRLIWELAASCPVPYVGPNALPEHVVESEQRRLTGYDFRVFVDGIELRKPAALSKNPGGYTIQRIPEQTVRAFGRDVTFHGYILVQEGKQLKPDELRGIMIRVKEVGIGLYDPSMLDYRYNEGPRSRWVTGEIFVTTGLEDALNIDRDSFNRFHPEFRVVQKRVHSILRDNIFPAVYKQIEVRSARRARERASERDRALTDVLEEHTDTTVRVRRSTREDASADDAPIVRPTERRIDVELPASDALPTRKSQRDLASAILTIFEISMLEKTLDARRKAFRDQLLALLARW
jgi:hypothetical protein